LGSKNPLFLTFFFGDFLKHGWHPSTLFDFLILGCHKMSTFWQKWTLFGPPEGSISNRNRISFDDFWHFKIDFFQKCHFLTPSGGSKTTIMRLKSFRAWLCPRGYFRFFDHFFDPFFYHFFWSFFDPLYTENLYLNFDQFLIIFLTIFLSLFLNPKMTQKWSFYWVFENPLFWPLFWPLFLPFFEIPAQ